jgi:hypothetical protein
MNYTDGFRAGRCLLPVIVYAEGREETGICLSALVDTGAMHSAIFVGIAEMLGLPRGNLNRIVSTPHGFQNAGSYEAVLDVPMLTAGGYVSRKFATLQSMLKMDSPTGHAPLIIGMDLISQSARFELQNGNWTLEFPNP